MEPDFPRIVTGEDIRFDIWLGLSQIPPSQWRDWILGKELKSEAARKVIVEKIAARLDRYQIRAEAPLPAHYLNPVSRQEFHNPAPEYPRPRAGKK